MLNFVLCDDNVHILNKFSKMLDLIFVNNDLDAKVVLSTPNPSEVLKYVENNQVDVLILDIIFKSDISGIDIANKIRAKNKKAYIIFATGHLEYLILAYKCKTFDYLPKPISMENLQTTILRLFDDIKATGSKKGFINIDNKDTLINDDLIYYIEKSKNKIVFRTHDSEYCVSSSFNRLVHKLPENFVRCHKSYIVNVKNISKIENDTIFFDKSNKYTCSIGPVYKKNFMEVFNNEFNANFNE
ncbi:MAG: response regulator transcription factor [Clostridia bacterium]|nr:response regulator transcription factor [Clostridia bacterium]